MGSVTRASFIASLVVGLSVLVAAAAPVGADVITDWNQKALPIVTKYSLGAPAYRDLAIMHLAMYQCVNSIEPRYEPYKTKLDAPATASKEAAAAVSAAVVLSKLHPDDQAKIRSRRRSTIVTGPHHESHNDQ